MTTTRTEPFYAELGRRVAHARLGLNMSQAALGEALSPPVTRSSIANIESGKQRVLSHMLVQLAQVLRVDLNQLAPGAPVTVGAPPEDVAEELQKKLPASVNLVALAKSLQLRSVAPARRKVAR